MRFVKRQTLGLLLITRMASSMQRPRTAIIGAGPAGLIASKSLQELGIEHVIFEHRGISGSWSSTKPRMWHALKTNQSKYTCEVSDRPWSREAPLFPSRDQMDTYLRLLCNLESLSSNLIFGSVKKITKLDGEACYSVDWQPVESAEVVQDKFTNIIVCTGFFSSATSNNNLKLDDFQGKILHSDKYLEPLPFIGKKVLVAGGAFSGCEVASDLATAGVSVHQVISQHAYVIPTYIAEDNNNPSTAFLPVDLVFRRMNDDKLAKLDTAIEANKPFELFIKSPKDDQQLHDYFKTLLGPDSSQDILRGADRNAKAKVSISDNYRRMASSGRIKQHYGRLQGISSVHGAEVVSRDGSKEIIAESFDTVILATGFTPDASIYSSDILQQIEYNEVDSQDVPFILHQEMLHPLLPGLFMVGMYKGPYMAVMELQAVPHFSFFNLYYELILLFLLVFAQKLVAQYIAGIKPWPILADVETSLQTARELRAHRPKPQFPRSDYIGMLMDLSRELGILPTSAWRNEHRVITPAYFTQDPTAMHAVEEDIEELRKGKYIAKSILRSLEGGKWSFHRRLFDKKTCAESLVTGSLTFDPISSSPAMKHVLYKEQGALILPNGNRFDVSQHYVFHYNEEMDCLDIFFSKVGNPEEIDRHFLSLQLTPTPEGWMAKADHLCSADNYSAKYVFAFQGMSIASFRVEFDVNGPAKDYQSITEFTIITDNQSFIA